MKQLAVVVKQNLIKLNISKAIKRYQDKQKKLFGFTFEDKQKMIARVYSSAFMAGQFSAANTAIDLLNRMDGDYATEKRQVEIKKPKRLVITVARPIN